MGIYRCEAEWEEMQVAKRKLFDGLMEGIATMKRHRKGKLMLRSSKMEIRRKEQARQK